MVVPAAAFARLGFGTSRCIERGETMSGSEAVSRAPSPLNGERAGVRGEIYRVLSLGGKVEVPPLSITAAPVRRRLS